MTEREPDSLKGTHLFKHPKSGRYYWRRVDPQTGKRICRSTRTKVLDYALRVAARYEDEHERKLAGLQDLRNWKLDPRPLVEEWVEHQRRLGRIQESSLRTKRFQALRALDDLRIQRLADLDRLATLGDRLLELERGGAPRGRLRQAYQVVLKQFSKWLAGNRRYLEVDPLASWELLPKPASKRSRRALMPDEVARAFWALESLDRVLGRRFPSRLPFLVGLITAARFKALATRTVLDFDPETRRLDLGPGRGNKRTGVGALDPLTTAELQAYTAGRKGSDLLLLSPKGSTLRPERHLDRWREAVALGWIDQACPKSIPLDLELAIQVVTFLLQGTHRVNGGGNPLRKRLETERSVRRREREVEDVAGVLREEFEEVMRGVDVHGLRKTHRTWALAEEVNPILIDCQLGHAAGRTAEGIEVMRVRAATRTGSRHYTDLASPLLDPSPSAEAVRRLLDQASARLSEAGTRVLDPPAGQRFRVG